MAISVNNDGRMSWLVVNRTSGLIGIGDLKKIPALKPGANVDLLDYYTEEELSRSDLLLAMIKAGHILVVKQHDNRTVKVTAEVAEDKITDSGGDHGIIFGINSLVANPDENNLAEQYTWLRSSDRIGMGNISSNNKRYLILAPGDYAGAGNTITDAHINVQVVELVSGTTTNVTVS